MNKVAVSKHAEPHYVTSNNNKSVSPKGLQRKSHLGPELKKTRVERRGANDAWMLRKKLHFYSLFILKKEADNVFSKIV